MRPTSLPSLAVMTVTTSYLGPHPHFAPFQFSIHCATALGYIPRIESHRITPTPQSSNPSMASDWSEGKKAFRKARKALTGLGPPLTLLSLSCLHRHFTGIWGGAHWPPYLDLRSPITHWYPSLRIRAFCRWPLSSIPS